MNKTLALSLSAILAAAALPASAAELVVVNLDAGTGAGLDDPTPRAPEGSNPGRTLGEQRRIAYDYAAKMWGSMLQSNVPVYVGARFIPLTCTVSSATLGSAGTTFVFRDFPGAKAAGTWYHSALADSLAGVDLAPGEIDIISQFNSRINSDPTCLGGSTWYYGLDGQTPAGQVNFLNVVMHEIAHGLGFSAFSNVSSGTLFNGLPDTYNRNAYNNTLAKAIPAMTNAERQFAFRDNGNTVWTGATVTAAVPAYLEGRFALQVTAPAPLAGFYDAGRSTLGPVATPAGYAGEVVLINDGVGATADGCEPATNAAALAGKIALIDRGTCAFNIKASQAQAAGARGVLIANNVAGVIEPGGADASITIPVVGISLADGNAIKAALPGVLVNAAIDPVRRQGADAAGRARLYVPAAVAPGSTFSHFDTALSPNVLMEPSITSTLRAEFNVDLTPALFKDIGWNLATGAKLGDCDTGIQAVGATGISLGGSLVGDSAVCQATSATRQQYTKCMTDVANALYQERLITGTQASNVVRCAVRQGVTLYSR